MTTITEAHDVDEETGESLNPPVLAVEQERKLRRLMEPTDPALISKRRGGGGMLDYVKWSSKWRLLISEFPAARFNILDLTQDESGWTVRGAISIGGITRENVGYAPHKKGTEDNGSKDAVSDCLSRCAALFGVGLDLYDGWEGDDAQPAALPQKPPQQPRSAAQPTVGGRKSDSPPNAPQKANTDEFRPSKEKAAPQFFALLRQAEAGLATVFEIKADEVQPRVKAWIDVYYPKVGDERSVEDWNAASRYLFEAMGTDAAWDELCAQINDAHEGGAEGAAEPATKLDDDIPF